MKASALMGKVVLIGITIVDGTGEVIERDQLYGMIVAVDPKHGIELNLQGKYTGKKYRLPPDLRPFKEKAPPGEYRLKRGGKVVDPDYVVSWTITRTGKKK